MGERKIVSEVDTPDLCTRVGLLCKQIFRREGEEVADEVLSALEIRPLSYVVSHRPDSNFKPTVVEDAITKHWNDIVLSKQFVRGVRRVLLTEAAKAAKPPPSHTSKILRSLLPQEILRVQE